MTAALSSSDIFLSYRYSVISARSFTEYKVSSIVATTLFAVFNSLSLRISNMYSLPNKTRTFSNRSITCVLLQRVEKLAERGVLGFLPCRNGVPKSFKVTETVRLPLKLDLCLSKSRFSVIGHTTTTVLAAVGFISRILQSCVPSTKIPFAHLLSHHRICFTCIFQATSNHNMQNSSA